MAPMKAKTGCPCGATTMEIIESGEVEVFVRGESRILFVLRDGDEVAGVPGASFTSKCCHTEFIIERIDNDHYRLVAP